MKWVSSGYMLHVSIKSCFKILLHFSLGIPSGQFSKGTSNAFILYAAIFFHTQLEVNFLDTANSKQPKSCSCNTSAQKSQTDNLKFGAHFLSTTFCVEMSSVQCPGFKAGPGTVFTQYQHPSRHKTFRRACYKLCSGTTGSAKES